MILKRSGLVWKTGNFCLISTELCRVGVIKIVIVINCNLITFSKVIACNCN